MDQWLDFDSDGSIKKVDSQKEKQSVMIHSWGRDLLVIIVMEQRNLFCLICNKSSSAESVKPSKFKRHFITSCGKHSDKPIDYFERLLKSLAKQKQFTNFFSL